MDIAIVSVYGLFAFVALLNLLLMRRPLLPGVASICILVPARDEAHNLAELLPQLLPQMRDGERVYVFDDESSDETASVAEQRGAVVVRPSEPLPTGWTGKNRACHELAKAAIEDSEARWLLFLDADVRVGDDFLAKMRGICDRQPGAVGVVTGFGKMIPGRGIEPLFLGWVGWILLCTNPYGLVNRSGLGHSRFTNGQIHCWRAEVYARLWPNERVKGSVLEDIKIGRLLARERIGVEVANLTSVMRVRMYETWREALDGMSKNSYEITGSVAGTAAVFALFLVLAWGWAAAGKFEWLALAILSSSGAIVAITVRTRLWPAVLMPAMLTIAAFTMLRSMVWHRRGLVRWKGRTYG